MSGCITPIVSIDPTTTFTPNSISATSSVKALPTVQPIPSESIPTPTVALTHTPTLTLTPTPTVSPTLPPLPTLSAKCGTVKLGVPGTQRRDKSHPVLAQGIAILCGQIFFSPNDQPQTISVPQAQLDLDTGLIGDEQADIEFYPGAGSDIFYYFRAINHAIIEEWSLNGLTNEYPPEPTFDDCNSMTNPFDNDNEPNYVCVRTSKGNVARVKIEQYNPLGKYALAVKISFIAWDNPENP